MGVEGNQPGTVKVEAYVGGDLSKETNWWGAFVVGLAGTILVTGVTGPVLAGLGSAAIPNFFFWTVTGGLMCMILAEMAAMLPERTGGAPAYAYFAFKDRLPRLYPHINGVTLWMYWLGWMPVMAVNNILTAAYLPALFGFHDHTAVMANLFGTPVTIFTFLFGAVLSVVLFIPAYLGIKFGAATATVLGLLSMIPLTFMAILPFFKPATLHAANLWPLHTPDGAALFSGHGLFLSLQFSALLTWNVIAMEAAACYIGECRNPKRDAPMAMNLEAGYGVFIYTVLPLVVLGVVGLKGVTANAAAPVSLFSTFAGKVAHIPGIDKLVSIALVIALALSSLNAIMGCARSVYQMALDGQFPRIFAHVNRHNVPDIAMGLNVVMNVFLVLLGTPGTIYVYSNVGYVGSFVPVMLGYYFLRRWRPELERPYRLPEFFKYIALFLALMFFVAWAIGIPACVIKGCQAGGIKAFFIGIAVVLTYFPLYWWRKAQDRRLGTTDVKATARAAGP